MKTIEEIHESQNKKFGYRVKCGDYGGVYKVIGYDSDDDNFFLRDVLSGATCFFKACLGEFRFIPEPIELWVNTYEKLGNRYCSYHASEALANHARELAQPTFLRMTKFREVGGEA